MYSKKLLELITLTVATVVIHLQSRDLVAEDLMAGLHLRMYGLKFIFQP